MKNEQINIFGWLRPRGFLMKHWRTIDPIGIDIVRTRLENAPPPDSLHKEVSSIVQGQDNSVDNIILAGFDNDRNIVILRVI